MSPQPLAVPLKVFIFKIVKCDEYTTCGKCIRSDIVVVVLILLLLFFVTRLVDGR